MKIDSMSVTIANAARVVVAGEAAIRGGDPHIDFTGVTRCDTAAVACLLAWQRCAQEAGVKLTVTGLPRDLESLATLYGVRGLLPS